jgi:pyrimidine operon attenuation protein/uracil phosphoribosyltransferase
MGSKQAEIGRVSQKGQLMSASEIDRTLLRLAHEIVARNEGVEDLVLIGIRRRGAPLAERLAGKIEGIQGARTPVGELDITYHRDDRSPLHSKPVVQPAPLPFGIQEKGIILVDDVLYTGRTARAALDALVDYGRPRRVQLCVLIDRGHRELPIQANYVGRTVRTTEDQFIEVRLREVDEEDRVLVVEP